MSTPLDQPYFLGNRLCLDFANLGMTSGETLEEPPNWDELTDFLAAKQIISVEKKENLRKLPASDVHAAEILLRHAAELNAALKKSFRAMLGGQRVIGEWAEPINRILRVTEGHDELQWDRTTWRLGFVGREESLDWLLAAIARSGAELIAEGATEKLRQCGNPQCHMLFYDESRTHRRRWCSMKLCGNRSKVAAFARRQSGNEKARAHYA
jgi:predicted RNA-binding Zn ribbon-like protein